MAQMKYYYELTISSSPHIHAPATTQTLMRDVLIALCPALVMAVYVFGFRALMLTLVSAAACVFFEWGYCTLIHRPVMIYDCSAIVTGVLLAFVCPVTIPYWNLILGDLFAIVLVKQLFGGLGQKLVNPAVTARVFMFIAFATEMTTWPVSLVTSLSQDSMVAVDGVDAMTAATALGQLGHGDGTLGSVTYSNLDLFLGNCGGCLGEVSALALLIGGLFLIWRKIISPIIPLTFLATVFVLGFIWGGLDGAIFHIVAGGVMLGAFFCATDYVTSPTLPMGKVIFGIGCGLFTMLIRVFASYPEGVSFAILLMNILVPFIDNFCEGKKFPLPKKEKGGKGNE